MQVDDPRRNFTRCGLDTVRLSEKQWATALADMDAKAGAFSGKNRRKESRKRYKKTLRIVVRVAHPGGSEMTFAVRTRDLSARGLGFVHGNFLYPGTPCTIILPTNDKRMIAYHGKIVRCRLAGGKLHEVGVEFGENLDLSAHLDEDVELADDAE